MRGKISAVAVISTGPEEKDLDAGLPTILMQRDDVGVLHAFKVDILMRLYLRQGVDTVANARRTFKIQRIAGGLHLLNQFSLNGATAIGQKFSRFFDEKSVIFF